MHGENFAKASRLRQRASRTRSPDTDTGRYTSTVDSIATHSLRARDSATACTTRM
jgi:hypothetical protein